MDYLPPFLVDLSILVAVALARRCACKMQGYISVDPLLVICERLFGVIVGLVLKFALFLLGVGMKVVLMSSDEEKKVDNRLVGSIA